MRSYKSADQRKTEILEAALDLFSRQGFQDTTMEQISSHIKMARTSLYEYYKSKEDILYSLINEIVEEEREKPLEGSIRAQLEVLAAESIARLQKNFTLYKILFQELPTLSNPTFDKIRAWQGRSMILVHEVIVNGIKEEAFKATRKPEDIAFVFKALIGQRLADILITDTQVEPEVEAKRLIDLMWFGIGQEGSDIS
ncbi:TetR/AcrR family transcriptional regulator [Alkalibacter saccharofermentans]|uniref:Transcriptional regulator, TetR family n=1 Tax=Alkalibacter saccharofermentans DSM 14828 TaxID=1120975 RepID=A0A1M4ZCM1_9FIRM|nr:TetR/AcrR family transcriptional regulator [Alkalibacter saccharofermentans]SHF15780.1 transcriptional regulator, TetR family [Alkalibacter saccharofermentans DSM 14828]